MMFNVWKFNVWKFIALLRGWREAWDEDETPRLLVVYHPGRGIHFTGERAWRSACQMGD